VNKEIFTLFYTQQQRSLWEWTNNHESVLKNLVSQAVSTKIWTVLCGVKTKWINEISMNQSSYIWDSSLLGSDAPSLASWFLKLLWNIKNNSPSNRAPHPNLTTVETPKPLIFHSLLTAVKYCKFQKLLSQCNVVCVTCCNKNNQSLLYAHRISPHWEKWEECSHNKFKTTCITLKMPFPTCFSQDKSFTFNNREWQSYTHNRLYKCILNSCYKWPANARFWVSTPVYLRIQVFWDLRQCHWVHF
jgi:hypothetical protein